MHKATCIITDIWDFNDEEGLVIIPFITIILVSNTIKHQNSNTICWQGKQGWRKFSSKKITWMHLLSFNINNAQSMRTPKIYNLKCLANTFNLGKIFDLLHRHHNLNNTETDYVILFKDWKSKGSINIILLGLTNSCVLIISKESINKSPLKTLPKKTLLGNPTLKN